MKNPNVAETQQTQPVAEQQTAQPKADTTGQKGPIVPTVGGTAPYASGQGPTGFNGGKDVAVDRMTKALQEEEKKRAAGGTTTQLVGGPNETREQATGEDRYLYEPGGTEQPSLKDQIIAGRENPGDEPPAGGVYTGGTSAPASTTPTVDTGATSPDPYADIIAQLEQQIGQAKADTVNHVDTSEQERLLQELKAAQEKQAQGQIDYAVEKGVNDLNRALEDANPQYQAMRNQIAANEAQALDNQALYAEARGDRGGIGQAQYASIQNTAATNQLTVNKEQTKLATDTARQIADLRAQGEFQKADQLLSITQNYLSQLMQLKQWADQANISIDEFNIGVQKWEQEYNAQVQQTLAGMKMSALDKNLDRNAQVAQQMIAAGVTPTDQQLEALGWNKDQYAAYKALQAAAQASVGTGKKSSQWDTELQNLMLGGETVEKLRQNVDRWYQAGVITADERKDMTGTINNAVKLGYDGPGLEP